MDARAVSAILDNIAATEELFDSEGPATGGRPEGGPPALLGTVCGSEAAQRFWQRQLEQMQFELGAKRVVSLHEDLPVNQAFGLLLMWQRIRDLVESGAGTLIAFVFGEGSRATPLTECEGGQKPAMRSFVMQGSGYARRSSSIVELALRYFTPVEAFLRRSGFRGVVIKWGDEIQIPTLSLRATDERFRNADVVRFVSITEMTANLAANKDWVGVDDAGRVTAFIPRRPLDEMASLAERGLLQRRGDALFGGINLGSIALSDDLLEALLDEFNAEVNDPTADRKMRPDLDPQLFTALTLAALEDPAERAAAWTQSVGESKAMAKLDHDMPGILDRLRGVLDRFEASHGRPVKMVAMDFGDQYWGDIGQHRAMFDLYTSLLEPGATGQITRAIAGLTVEPDEDGNRMAGSARLGTGVTVRNSVLIDVHVEEGHIEDSVLIGTQCQTLYAQGAFDVQSTVGELRLEPRSGAYRLVDSGALTVGAGERLTTVFLEDERYHLRVHEDENLRDRIATYDTAIHGNALSFAEAHGRALASDLDLSDRAREALQQEVLNRIHSDEE